MKHLISLTILFFLIQTRIYCQSLGDFDGIKNTNNYYEKILTTSEFGNGVSDQAINVLLGNISMWGNIEVEITGTYYYQNTPGKLSKVFAVGYNPNGSIYANESRVNEAMGPIVDNIAIGDLEWNSSNQQYLIPLYHITNTNNSFTIRVRFFSHDYYAGNMITNLSLSEIYNRTSVQRNYVYFNSKIGIGTTSPSEKLSVNGNISSKKSIVTQTGWSDYVFNDDYKLRPLNEVEKFVQENKHLPEVPSAKEVEEKGLDLGANQAVLLKKIEELTLYMIEQEKKIKSLISQVDQQQRQISSLTK